MHVAPFVPFADYFSLGRGEESVINLVKKLDGKQGIFDDSIICSNSFSLDNIYRIKQGKPYEYPVLLKNGSFCEKTIGCNHKCLFCGYTWHRKFCSPYKSYKMDDELFGGIADKELAMLDMKNGEQIDLSKLRTTAIDGMSERLRYMVNKRISKEMLIDFLKSCINSDAKPHQIKLYNIVGYPTETDEDWNEYVETLAAADDDVKHEKQWCFLLNCTPFRPMPATPLACAPASKRNYRGEIGRILGQHLKGNIIFQGNALWSVEGMGTDSLSTVMLSMIAHRGSSQDAENIVRICKTPKFWSAPSAVREATLEKYFDMDTLFGEYTETTLPSRYLRTYAQIEKMWRQPPWKDPWAIKPGKEKGVLL